MLFGTRYKILRALSIQSLSAFGTFLCRFPWLLLGAVSRLYHILFNLSENFVLFLNIFPWATVSIRTLSGSLVMSEWLVFFLKFLYFVQKCILLIFEFLNKKMVYMIKFGLFRNWLFFFLEILNLLLESFLIEFKLLL